MNANEARKLTEESLRGPIIAPMLEHVHRRIAEAAKAGRRALAHPLTGRVPMEWHESAAKEALWLALQNEGYQVEHRPDPDPGYPNSGPYTVISW